ncbi:MAG: carbohydrate ABC transporter permease [Microbacterium sp.]|uniref:carbohydrate ABC transporter permease n=1 Tax=Microbacterium sp. TaxID=51671 RepID=UPI003F7E5E05
MSAAAPVIAPPSSGVEREPVRKRRHRGGPAAGGRREAWLLVLPALIPVVIFSVYPLVQGILLGFTDARAGLDIPVNFNGIDNYTKLAGNGLFWNSFGIGLLWAFSVTILQFLASLGLALLLNLNLRFRWLARTLALVPWAMPPVIIAIMWRLMLNPSFGPVNEALRALGLPGDINWLGDASIALPAVIVVGVWAGMPQTTITLLAGLQTVPAELHEAAAIDGAGTWRRESVLTLPSHGSSPGTGAVAPRACSRTSTACLKTMT